jgi:2-oxoglutarate ferredoxin oxidoreductase subunit delta
MLPGEGFMKSVVISVNDKLCKGADGCGICLALCPKDVFTIAERLTARGVRLPVVEKVTACTSCGNCMIYCPDMAVVVRLDEIPEAVSALKDE